MRRIRQKGGAGVETAVGARPPLGGRFMPLTDADCDRVIDTSFAILDRIGLVGAPPEIRRLALENGAAERPDGRLSFSRALVDEMIARASKRVGLPGFDTVRGIEFGGGLCHAVIFRAFPDLRGCREGFGPTQPSMLRYGLRVQSDSVMVQSSALATVKMSLSPRPHMFMQMT